MGQYITFLYIITYCVQTYMSCHAAYAYVEIGGEYVHMSFVLTCVVVYGVGEGMGEYVHPYMLVAPGLLLLLTLTSHWPIQSAQSKCT